MIRRLILWRHGRTEWNASARFQGHADPGLDDVGLDQAHAAAAVLVREQPDTIYSSDLRRAVSTARRLAELTGLPVTETPELRETNLGAWEGLTRDEVAVQFPDELAAWQAGDEIRRGQGETASEVADRAEAFLASVDGSAGETVVFVAHGGTNKALAARLMGLDAGLWMRLSPLANCHWSELRRDSRALGKWRLHSHNVGPLTAVPTRTETAAEGTPNVDSDEAPTNPPLARPAVYTGAEVAGAYRYGQLRGAIPPEASAAEPTAG